MNRKGIGLQFHFDVLFLVFVVGQLHHEISFFYCLSFLLVFFVGNASFALHDTPTAHPKKWPAPNARRTKSRVARPRPSGTWPSSPCPQNPLHHRSAAAVTVLLVVSVSLVRGSKCPDGTVQARWHSRKYASTKIPPNCSSARPPLNDWCEK